MKKHLVRVYPSKEKLPRENQLAWKMAEVASDKVKINEKVTDMVINRIIDNASVAIAAINRHPVASARAMAIAHPRANGATVFGMPNDQRFDCEWTAWANGTAVRELDFHDTFLAADYSHPGDNIPPMLAVAQQTGKSGADLLRGIVTGYELHVNLVKGICLHKHKKDHIAHLCPATAGGIGTMLGLSTETIYQAIQQAVHVSFTTRQSRKGEISSWKAYAPAHSGKLAIEAVDRVMRGEGAPSPIYEGEDSVIAYMLDCKDGKYEVPLPGPGEEKLAILETYTKEHSAEYQSQALIDLALTTNWFDYYNIEYPTGGQYAYTTKKWEADRAIGYSFGYNKQEETDQSHALSGEALVRMLADVVSKNGNLLLGIGPKADGTIPTWQVTRLQALGGWLNKNGAAIYATRPWVTSEGYAQINGGATFEVRFTRSKDNNFLYTILMTNPQAQDVILRDSQFAHLSAGTTITVLNGSSPISASWQSVSSGTLVKLSIVSGLPQDDFPLVLKISPNPIQRV